MKHTMTTVGLEKIKATIKKLQIEATESMAEMKEVRENCLSTEDTTEVSQYAQRYQSIQDRIGEYVEVLNNSHVVDISTIQSDKVRFGLYITMIDLDTDEEKTYQLLSAYESDPKNGIISYTSPIGKSMLGLLEGDSFDLDVGPTTKEYEIISISNTRD